MSRRTARWVALLLIVLGSMVLAGASKATEDVSPAMAPRFARFLEEVAVLLTAEERAAFLALSKDYQRDAFIERFWRERDPYPETVRNELRDSWEERVALVRDRYESLTDARAVFLMNNGTPSDHYKIHCRSITYPLEIWFYLDGTFTSPMPLVVIFYKPRGLGAWRLWHPGLGSGVFYSNGLIGGAPTNCDLDVLQAALKMISDINQGSPFNYDILLADHNEPPEPPPSEWVLTFGSYSTDLPDDAEIFAAEVAFAFPGRRQSRTVVQGRITVPRDAVLPASLAGAEVYNLLLNGEIVRGATLFESFRYRFDFPAGEVSAVLPVIYERALRPGEYRLILRLEDLNGQRFFRHEAELVVPDMAAAVPSARSEADADFTHALEEANRSLVAGEAAVKILAPFGELLTGLERFEALVVGEQVTQVSFAVDGRTVLSKRTPPYSVELDLGTLPRTLVLRVTAFNAAGEEVASDEMLVNASPHRFAVRLVEPVQGKTYGRSLRARVDVSVPASESLERVEIYRGDDRLATLYQPPFSHPVMLPDGQEMILVRAVGYLRDGTQAEDVAIVNGPPLSEEIGVDLVELYTTVLDGDRRPVQGLAEADFRVLEDRTEQEIRRFERVEDLPIHATIMLDVSASMGERLGHTRDAALRFFEQVAGPKDRLAAITFNDRPTVVAPYTHEQARFAAGLTGLKAERGTALYDSLIYALFYNNGLGGQRAVLLLSDGVDENSRFTFEETLDYARRAEVTVYTLGIDLEGRDARRVLSRLAEETGGRSFFLDDVTELDAVYDTIRDELRAKYLLAYQSTANGSEFRRVEVQVKGRGLEAKTIRGYYP